MYFSNRLNNIGSRFSRKNVTICSYVIESFDFSRYIWQLDKDHCQSNIDFTTR